MSRRYEFPKQLLELVRTMPFCEAEELLRQRRQEVLERLHASQQGADTVDLGYVLSALNDEIHILVTKQQRIKVGQAVRDCFGEEGFARWRERLAQMEVEA